MIILGLCGKAGAGKTTAAKMICLEFDDAYILPFAQPVKKYAMLMGWNGKKDTKGRRLLQLLGTDMGRKCIHHDIWVNHWHRALDELRYSADCVLADDMRFDNEGQRILRLGGHLIEITGRENPKDTDMSHASEVGLVSVKPHYRIENSGTPFDLSIKLNEILTEINEGQRYRDALAL